MRKCKFSSSIEFISSLNFEAFFKLTPPVRMDRKIIQPTKHNTTLPVKVLIVSGHRTGSTFLGELFNQNNAAFYSFEPLSALQNTEPTLGCSRTECKYLPKQTIDCSVSLLVISQVFRRYSSRLGIAPF